MPDRNLSGLIHFPPYTVPSVPDEMNLLVVVNNTTEGIELYRDGEKIYDSADE